jgi:hypothetical protein
VGFGVLWALFEGGAGKMDVFAWCFVVEVVVDCVVIRGWLTVDFAGRKICQFFKIFLWKFGRLAGCGMTPTGT